MTAAVGESEFGVTPMLRVADLAHVQASSHYCRHTQASHTLTSTLSIAAATSAANTRHSAHTNKHTSECSWC